MKTRYRNILMAVAAVLLISALVLHLLNRYVLLEDVLLVTASLLAGLPIFLKATKAIRMKMFSIDLLVSIAIIGALAIGEYIESAVVSFLFLFGAYLEVRTLERARSSLKSLMNLKPLKAVVLKGGQRVTVLAENVKIGDRVVVRTGARIPVDGRVVSGQALINESSITGESVPVKKKENDQVFSSTILDSGYLEVEAEKVGEDTAFARILESVEEAQESKVRAQRFLERFARYYTPGILILSLIVLVVSWDIHLSLTFLVIACPGALVISAPVSIVAGIGKAAKMGILVKGGNEMENLSKVSGIIFDKTGTLTEGRPQVTKVQAFEISQRELLQLAARAELASEHHLGRAIMEKASSLGLEELVPAEKVEIHNGRGLEAIIDSKKVLLGNRRLLTENHVSLSEEMEKYALSEEENGNTIVLVATEESLLGIISIADKIRESAFEAVRQLRENGIQHMVMFTGDNRATAIRVAQQLGIDQVHAELLPEEKATKVKSCMDKRLHLAMVGDGVNDAPALATANLGIAVGAAATDAAMDTADVVLMSSNLKRLAYAHRLAKATVLNMKENMFFSVGVVFVLLLGVLSGNVHLASGMLIHELSVLLVILNAFRLVRFPGYDLRLKHWFWQWKSSLYFPSVLAKIKRKRMQELNGCRTHSLKKFQECSRC